MHASCEPQTKIGTCSLNPTRIPDTLYEHTPKSVLFPTDIHRLRFLLNFPPMASFQYDHNLWPEDDTNPWDAELSVTPRISSYNYGSPTVAVSVSGSSDRSDKTTPTETAHTLGWDTWGCYRIQNVPFTWTKSKLHLTLQKFESLGDIEESELSLFSTSPRSLIKTALLHREKCPECFRSLTTGRSHLLEVEEPAGERHFLSVDYEFYGLTPLNEPEGENIVEYATSFGFLVIYGSKSSRC